MVQLTPDPVIGPTLVKNWMAAAAGWGKSAARGCFASLRRLRRLRLPRQSQQERPALRVSLATSRPSSRGPRSVTGARDQALLPGQLLRKAASISVLTRRHSWPGIRLPGRVHLIPLLP